MVKMLTSLLLVIAIVITSISFSVNAEDDIFAEFNLFVKWNEGSAVTMPVHNGSSINLSITDTEFHNLEFYSIQFKKKPNSSYCNLSFDIHFYYYPTSVTMLTGGATVQNVNMDFTWYQCTLDPIPFGNFSYYPLGYAASLQTRFSTSDTNRTIGSTIRLKASALPQNTTIVRVVIDNVSSNTQLNFVLNYILDCQNTLLSPLLNLVDYTLLFLQRLTEDNSFSVSVDYYDSDGNFIQGEKIRTTWYNAIYQLLSNMYAPVQLQSEQEQKAKEAGAMDALDDAYEAADDAGSFWDLIPFIGFVGFGDYDDDAASDLGTGSITDWFSSTNQGWLDNVPPAPKSDPEEFIDFYQQNLNDIEDLLGSEVSNSIRGSP